MYDVLRFVLAVIIFIGLKMFELIKVIWKYTGRVLIKYWKNISIGIGIVGFVIGWLNSFAWQAQYFGITLDEVILRNVVGFLVLLWIVALITMFWVNISKHFANNWYQAKRMSDKIMNKL